MADASGTEPQTPRSLVQRLNHSAMRSTLVNPLEHQNTAFCVLNDQILSRSVKHHQKAGLKLHMFLSTLMLQATQITQHDYHGNSVQSSSSCMRKALIYNRVPCNFRFLLTPLFLHRINRISKPKERSICKVS